MIATLTHTSSVIRVYTDDATDGPYDVAMTVLWHSPVEVELIGLDKPITSSHCQAIKSVLASHGVQRIKIRRWRAGKFHDHTIPVSRWESWTTTTDS